MSTLIIVSQESQSLSKISTSDEIKAYFRKVFELTKSGEEFPVDLEMVWPLAYASKHKAVEVLKNGFIENVDYQVFTRSGENPSGGRPTSDYKLAVSCMEYLIVKKVRPVFEVYRRVFHHSAKQAQVDSALLLIESVAKTLNLNDNSKLLMYQKAADKYGIDRSLLPSYTTSAGTLVPLSRILEGTAFSARKANPILWAKGILEKKWRRSSRGEQVCFWNIRDAYRYLGENQVCPNNPKETQPMWFEEKRSELLKLIS